MGGRISKRFFIGIGLVLAAVCVRAQDSVELYERPHEKRTLTNINFGDISFGLLLEAEVSAGKDAGEDVSDITLSTFQFTMEAKVNEWIGGRAVLLWEEDDTEPIDLDEGIIMFGNPTVTPFSMEIGRMYLPFGVYESHFVSDPLTLELGEICQSAVAFGYTVDKLKIKVGVFNGDVTEEGDDSINEGFAAISLTPVDNLTVGSYWLSNIGDTDGLRETVLEQIDAGVSYDRIGGAGAYLHTEVGAVAFDVEYLAAVESFASGVLAVADIKPQTWNAELAYTFSDKIEVAGKYEGSDDFPDMPENQWGLVGNYALMENTVLALEYMHGTYADDTGNRDMVTFQVALEF
jgi:hypothetical protein